MSSSFDVAVVGLGPAGRALASACLARGMRVLAIDPRPEGRWTPTYGIWGDELGALPEDVIRERVVHPELRVRGRYPLRRDYLVLDNAALQAALPLAGAELKQARLTDDDVTALLSEARVVVDARGARPNGSRPDDPAPAQTAYGIVVEAADAAPALDGAAGLLMDWGTDWADDHIPAPPTFLYAIPVGGGRILLEETCLAAAPGLPIDELKRRLRRRLLQRGVDPDVIDHPLEREVVRIPMRGRGEPAPPGVLAVGTAGRGGNIVTGYSVAHSLRRAETLADELAAGHTPRAADPIGPTDLFREMGLRALLRLDTPGTLALFEAFGRIPTASQREFMSRDASVPGLAGAMWGMFVRMPARAKRALIAATLGPA